MFFFYFLFAAVAAAWAICCILSALMCVCVCERYEGTEEEFSHCIRFKIWMHGCLNLKSYDYTCIMHKWIASLSFLSSIFGSVRLYRCRNSISIPVRVWINRPTGISICWNCHWIVLFVLFFMFRSMTGFVQRLSQSAVAWLIGWWKENRKYERHIPHTYIHHKAHDFILNGIIVFRPSITP